MQRMPGWFDNKANPCSHGKEEVKTLYYDKEEYEEEDVDTDMIPMLLVHCDGKLIHNLVQVDWEEGEAGVEELLSRHIVRPCSSHVLWLAWFRWYIITGVSISGNGNCGLPLDEEDLIWSDDEATS